MTLIIKVKSKIDLLTLFFIFNLAVGTCFQTYRSLKWGHDSWQMTELLINYSGGFVRRGLFGEAILRLSAISGIQANYLAIFVCIIAYLSLLAFLILHTKKIFPASLIFSSVLLGAPAYQDYIIRKDALGIVLLIACLVITQKRWDVRIRMVLINLLGIIAILSHEAFFFFGLPILIIMNSQPPKDYHPYSCCKEFLLSIGKLSALFFAFAISCIYKGNTIVANTINNSWHDLWVQINPGGIGYDKPSKAIDALQWSASQGFSCTIRVFNEYSMGIYAPLAWLITIGLCFFLIICSLNPKTKCRQDDNHNNFIILKASKIATILIFQFISIFPLFAIGYDYGRWIFIWTTTSIAIFLLKEDLPIVGMKMDKISDSIVRFILNRYKFNSSILLFFGVPHSAWSVVSFIQSSPAGYFIYKIRSLMTYIL